MLPTEEGDLLVMIRKKCANCYRCSSSNNNDTNTTNTTTSNTNTTSTTTDTVNDNSCRVRLYRELLLTAHTFSTLSLIHI